MKTYTRGIEARDLRFGYGRGSSGIHVGHLQVPPGLTLVLGPNGAGKSTLLRVLAGIEMPEHGTVYIDGADLWREEVRARQALAWIPEQPDLTPYVTIRDVLRLTAVLREADRAAVEEVLLRVELSTAADRGVRELSMGQRRRALIAAAMIGDSTCILLDEPLETLDANIRTTLLDWIRERLGAGATILVATHELEPFLGTATGAIAVREGEAWLAPWPAVGAERAAFAEALARGAVPPEPTT